MSLTTGFFALKGEYTGKLTEVFKFFNLDDTHHDIVLHTWQAAADVMEEEYYKEGNGSTQRRVVWVDNGWTIIADDSFLLCTDDDALLNMSVAFSTPVFALQTQGTSSCYGFSYYDKEKLRQFFSADGEVNPDYGPPLAEEAGFNINKDAFYDDVHGVAKNFGIDWEHAEKLNRFIVKELTDTEGAATSAISEDDLPAFADKSRPWWKFW